MATTYIGTPNYTTSITIPVDGELAAASTVNNPAKSSVDMDYFLLQSMGLLTQGAPVTLSSSNGTSITVSAIPLAIVNENGVYKAINTASAVSLTNANLEIAGAFTANTWYFIYIYSVGGVANFQLSKTPPSQYNLFKQGSDSHRYLGSFRVNASGFIVKFFASRGQYVYMDVATQLSNANDITESPLSLSSVVPVTSRFVDTHLTIANSIGLDGYIRLATFFGGPFTQFTAYANKTNDFSYSMATGFTQTINYYVGTATTFLSINVLGYRE